MRQCIDASQSVERMFSCSPPRQLSSESPDHTATHPPDHILTLTPRPDPAAAPRAATAASAAASAASPPSKRSPAHHHAATPPHPTRRSSSTGASLADARRRREQQQQQSTSQHQPQHLHIQKSCHADGADILTCRGLGLRSAAAARTPAAPSELHRRLDEQARELAAQRVRLGFLEGAVAHLSLLAGIDAVELMRLAEQRRLNFFRETPEGWVAAAAAAETEAADSATASVPACAPHSPPVEVWIRISSFLCPRSEAYALRLVRKRDSAMRRAGDLCYLAWFKAERVRALGVGSSAFQRLLIPGAAQCRILLSHCDARLVRDDGTHERLGDRSVVSAPASIQLKGRGKGKVSIVTNIRVFDVPDAHATDSRAKGPQRSGAQPSTGGPPSSLTQELPQGSLTLRSVSPHVEATFAHARWYPLPGDSVVVIKAGVTLPPLAEVASEASVAALLRNTEGLNPWTFKVEIPLGEGAPRGEYELRYIDSLARPLAFSDPFTL